MTTIAFSGDLGKKCLQRRTGFPHYGYTDQGTHGCVHPGVKRGQNSQGWSWPERRAAKLQWMLLDTPVMIDRLHRVIATTAGSFPRTSVNGQTYKMFNHWIPSSFFQASQLAYLETYIVCLVSRCKSLCARASRFDELSEHHDVFTLPFVMLHHAAK